MFERRKNGVQLKINFFEDVFIEKFSWLCFDYIFNHDLYEILLNLKL